MSIMDINNLKGYTKDELVKIAIFNDLYKNNYYMSKRELRIALYSCYIANIVLYVPETMSTKYFTKRCL